MTPEVLKELGQIFSPSYEPSLLDGFRAYQIRAFIEGDELFIHMPYPTPPHLFKTVTQLRRTFHYKFAKGATFKGVKSSQPGYATYRIKLRT